MPLFLLVGITYTIRTRDNNLPRRRHLFVALSVRLKTVNAHFIDGQIKRTMGEKAVNITSPNFLLVLALTIRDIWVAQLYNSLYY